MRPLRLIITLLPLLVLATIGCGPRAQTFRAALPPDVYQIGSFGDARALSIDATDRVYIAEASTNQIFVLDKNGKRIMTFGGPGLADGQFDEPTDIDATNGLSILVTDFGNGRVQRFSRTGVFLESFPVLSVASGDTRPNFSGDRQEAARQSRGQPVGVTAAGSEDVYVLEKRSSSVIAIDRNRQVLWRTGIGGAGAARIRPVSIEGRRDSLFVVDRSSNTVALLDVGGALLSTWDAGLSASRIAQTPRRVVVVGDSGLRCVGDEAWFEMPPGPGALIDAAFSGERWYFLTNRSLLVTEHIRLCQGKGWATDSDDPKPRSSRLRDVRLGRDASSE